MTVIMGGRLKRTVIAITALQVLAGFAFAQAAGSEIRLTVRIPNGQTTFRIGETIPLELSFSSSNEQKYQLNMAFYDRSGRMNYERFSVDTPVGWTDPLSLYFRSAAGLMAGGVGASAALVAQPTPVPLDLNEWLRFDLPGDYRVTVESGRVSLRAQPSQRLPVVSNELRLTIVAAPPEWQQETLRKALAIMNSHPAPVPPSPGPRDVRTEAARTLRYLGTEAAARAMARWSQDPDCRLGLVGSPFRAAGLDEMRKLLQDPNIAIDRQFLDTMAFLAVPNTPGQHAEDKNDLADRFQQELISALPLKTGGALAASVQSIMQNPRGVDALARKSLTDALAANFDSLPMAMQFDLVNNRFGPVDRILLVSMLRKLAEHYLNSPQPQFAEAAEFSRAGGEALQRWYVVAPQDARPAMLREILRPEPRFPLDVLGILPDAELPEADQLLVSHLAGAESANNRVAARNLAWLIGRYATAAAGPELVALLDRDVTAGLCDTQAPLLAWLLRVNPDAARPRLESAAKTGSRCRLSLSEVGKLQPNSILESLAIKVLDDADTVTAPDAASYLADYGSVDAEEALWNHLTSWSKRWRDHEAELNRSGADAQAGLSLVQALINGHSWLVSDGKFRRLADLGVGAAMRQQTAQFMMMWQQRPWLVRSTGNGQFQILWYHAVSMKAAKEKLVQFPAGSEFRWILTESPNEPAELHELAEFEMNHGSKLY